MEEIDVIILKESIEELYNERGFIRDYGSVYYRVSKDDINAMIAQKEGTKKVPKRMR